MKIIGKVEIEAVVDVVCDVCQFSTRVTGGGLQFATLQAHWGWGTKHDGERYELHLCEGCFFRALLASNRNGAPKHSLAIIVGLIGPLSAMISV
jgi:hypothetical protein